MTDLDFIAQLLNFETPREFIDVARTVLSEEFTREELEISNKVHLRTLELLKSYVLIESASEK